MKKQIAASFVYLFIAYNSAFTQINNGLNFDGIDDYVDLNTLQSSMYANADHFTIEFWMRGDLNEQTSSIRTCMFAINEPAGENRLLIIMGGNAAQDGHLMIYPDGSWGPNAAYNSTEIIGDNICHHIAYSFDGTYGRVYIDGVLKDQHSIFYNITPSDRYSLGQEYDNLNTSQFFNGDIDDLRIWSEVRSDAQIAANMNMELSGTEAGLIAYYNFNQGGAGSNNQTVTTLNDITVNGLNGSLTNFALMGTSSNWVRPDCTDAFVGMDESDMTTLNLNVYPNPAIDLVSVAFELPVSSTVSIQITSVNGKVMDVMDATEMSSGQHQFQFETSVIEDGVYLVNIFVNENAINKRLVVMH